MVKNLNVDIAPNVNVIVYRSTVADVLNKSNFMLNLSKWRIFFVILVCLSGIYFLYPNFFNKTEVTALPNYVSKKQVNLGLDLQGGSHLLLR